MWWDELRYFTSRELDHGIAAPAIPAGCAPYVTENIGDDEMVILRSKQTWQNFISL